MELTGAAGATDTETEAAAGRINLPPNFTQLESSCNSDIMMEQTSSKKSSHD